MSDSLLSTLTASLIGCKGESITFAADLVTTGYWIGFGYGFFTAVLLDLPLEKDVPNLLLRFLSSSAFLAAIAFFFAISAILRAFNLMKYFLT